MSSHGDKYADWVDVERMYVSPKDVHMCSLTFQLMSGRVNLDQTCSSGPTLEMGTDFLAKSPRNDLSGIPFEGHHTDSSPMSADYTLISEPRDLRLDYFAAKLVDLEARKECAGLLAEAQDSLCVARVVQPQLSSVAFLFGSRVHRL